MIFATKNFDISVIDSLVAGSNNLKLNKEQLTKFIQVWFDAIYTVKTIPDRVDESIGNKFS